MRRSLVGLLCALFALALPVHSRGAGKSDQPETAQAATQDGKTTRKLPSPGDADSHLAYIERFREATGQAFDTLLAAYDEFLAGTPTSSVALMERCKLLEESVSDEWEDEHPRQEQLDECSERLAEQFPRDPEVCLFRLERDYGEESIEYGESVRKGGLENWSASQMSRLDAMLADRYSNMKRPDKAAELAELALRYDKNAGASLHFARHLIDTGRRGEAAQVLKENLQAATNAWVLQGQIELLADLSMFQAALGAMDQLRELSQGEVDPLLHARVLEGAGKWAEARAQYKSATARRWNRAAPLLKCFEFELAHGDASQALEAYTRLRDEGFSTDPYLRHRVALAVRHPGLAWQARDLLGASVLLAICTTLVVVAVIWLLPVHYIGLLRRQRNPALREEPHPVGLRQAWYLTAVVLLVSFLGIWWFDYGGLEDTWAGDSRLPRVARPPIPPIDEAHFGFLFFGVVGITSLLLARGRRPGWIRGQWTVGRSLGRGVACAWLIRIVFGMIYATVGEGQKANWAGWLAGLTGPEIVRAIATSYGFGIALLIGGVLVPIYEEIAFREILLGAFRKHLRFGWANLLQALVFALSHDTPKLIPFYMAMALVAGSLRRRSGGILAPVALHAFNNIASLFSLLRGG